jgi:hypothetical protein
MMCGGMAVPGDCERMMVAFSPYRVEEIAGRGGDCYPSYLSLKYG